MMKKIATVAVMVMMLAMVTSGCASLAQRAVGATNDVVMAGPNMVTAEAKAVVGLAKGATEDHPYSTLWNMTLFPLKAAKVAMDSLSDSVGSLFSHLGGK